MSMSGPGDEPKWKKDLFQLDTPETAIAACRTLVHDLRISMWQAYENDADKVQAREKFQKKFDEVVKPAAYATLDREDVKKEFAAAYATKDAQEMNARLVVISKLIDTAIRDAWNGDSELQKIGDSNRVFNYREGGSQRLEEAPHLRLIIGLSTYFLNLRDELVRKLRK